MAKFRITPRGEFSLQASTRFLEGFAPARYRAGSTEPGDVRLRLAFPVEGNWQPTGVCVTQMHDAVDVEVFGEEPKGLREQVARILSLDVDGGGFADVRRRDEVVDRLAQAYPGLRPVCFCSPYEAACWAVIGHRIRITVAAGIKERIASEYGRSMVVDGVSIDTFPDPQTLQQVADELPLPTVKQQRLRGIAAAALAGELDAAGLRELAAADALDRLRRIDGIGPFSAELILVRGAGAPDVFPSEERRLHDSMVKLYGLRDMTREQLTAVADGWAPYRSWVGLLIRSRREETTGEIGGRRQSMQYES